MKKAWAGYAAALVLLVLLAVVVFRCALGADNAFAASDANIGQIAGGRPEMGEMFAPSYGGFILGAVRNPRFSPYGFLHAALPPFLFNDLYAPLTLVVSSFLLLVFLRLRERSWGASFFGAVSAFWLGSATLAAAGHYGKLGVACFFTASLVLLEKSLAAQGLRRLCWAVLCGTAVGFMLLSQQDIGLLFGVVLAPYALFRLVQTSPKKPLDWASTLLPIALIGLVLSVGTALSAYKTSVVQASSVNESTDGTWNFITQWSQPPQEFPDLLAPGFMGWKSGDPDAPYWGKTGQSAEWPGTKQGFQNFRLDSVYLGLVPFILALAALFSVGGRKEGRGERATLIFWWIMALVLLVLAFGKFTPLYKLVIKLPLFGSIRAPIKFLHNLGIVLGILSAYGIDAMLESEKARKRVWICAATVGGCFLLSGLALMLGASGFEGKLTAWGDSSPLILKRMMASSFYAAVAAGLFSLLAAKGAGKTAALFCGLACLFPVVDSLYLTKHYFHADDLAEMRRGNLVINYLKENNGQNRVFTFDRNGIYNRWIGVDFPLHGIKGFWFWQAPRLSQEYKDYLAGANQNIVALLQSTSVKYALAPVGAVNQLPKDVFKPVMFYRFGMGADGKLIVQSMARPERAQDQVILELQQTLPRLSLFSGWKKVAPEQMMGELFSKQNNLMEQVLVDADLPAATGTGFVEPVSVEWKTSSVKVQVDAKHDSVLLFTQRFQPQWKAYVDGQETPVFRSNALSMGIHVPAGTKEVVFKCTAKKMGSVLQLAGLVASAVSIGILVVCRRAG
ncbi:hypothetical protein PDESU_00826 [Pontiella desulfatans]|uniref:Bacterial membrane protein YfhO n=1 Tax=Pontiella desulfatans TaxID=2750659 RepID=A0A6C2TX73_PONDE|nr:hypothetical protein [Pontiella desulfatans]VGO12275.1 hypothetical protein PDESU_00826 [Pontiella desulfatans]